MTNKQNIDGITVVVQACWLDENLNVVANVGLDDPAKEGVQYHQVQISPEDRLSYPSLVIYRPLGRQMTFQEYDQYMQANLQKVRLLVVSLLTPAELIHLTPSP